MGAAASLLLGAASAGARGRWPLPVEGSRRSRRQRARPATSAVLDATGEGFAFSVSVRRYGSTKVQEVGVWDGMAVAALREARTVLFEHGWGAFVVAVVTALYRFLPGVEEARSSGVRNVTSSPGDL